MLFLRKVPYYLLIIILLIELAIIFFTSNIFVVTKIFSDGYFNPILLEIGGKNIGLINIDELRMTILESDPIIKNIFISKKYPNSLGISIEKRKPKVIVTNRNEKEHYFADSAGVVFEKAADLALTMIVTNKISIKLGARLTLPEESAALQIINNNNKLKIQKIIAKQDMLEVYVDNGAKALFKIEENYLNKLDTLQLLVKSFKIEDKVPKIIDLRFEKPIIKY